MRALGCLGIGLSLVSGCLLLAIVAELYYFFWWKKRKVMRNLEEEHCTSPVKELLHLFNWRKPSSPSSPALDPQASDDAATQPVDDEDLHLDSQPKNDTLLKPLEEEETEDAELISLVAPPRSLFTITEETLEDLEAADGSHRVGRSKNSSGGISLRDWLLSSETPVLTPISSPPLLSPPLTTSIGGFNLNGVNPLFEPSEGDGLNNLLWSSPPPKLKFLKDAEEKLHRKILQEQALRGQRSCRSVEDTDKMEVSSIEETRTIPVLCR